MLLRAHSLGLASSQLPHGITRYYIGQCTQVCIANNSTPAHFCLVVLRSLLYKRVQHGVQLQPKAVKLLPRNNRFLSDTPCSTTCTTTRPHLLTTTTRHTSLLSDTPCSTTFTTTRPHPCYYLLLLDVPASSSTLLAPLLILLVVSREQCLLLDASATSSTGV